MSQKGLRVVAAAVAIASTGLAVILPRQEIGHGDPDTLGGPSVIYYDYLVVTRVTVLVIGLAVAGVLYWLSRRTRRT